ncbi:hypothetical protein HRbin10_02308 [bacterium HR10]|nr:hypothetical protein HRbin10_02308 [bacterium HR10]
MKLRGLGLLLSALLWSNLHFLRASQLPPPPPVREEGWTLVTVLVGNVDEDPDLEYLVVLRAMPRDANAEGGVRLRFFDFDPESRTWMPTEITNESQESESRLFPPETAVTLEDITHDGRAEIIIRSRKPAESPGQAQGLTILTKQGRYLRQLFTSWEGAPELCDLDGDRIMEIVLYAEYVGPLSPEDAVLYPAQVFAYEGGAFRRASPLRYAAHFAETARAARAAYEALKRQWGSPPGTEHDPRKLFRSIAHVLLVHRTAEDIEGMRAYYLAERSWLRAQLPPVYLQALDDLLTPQASLRR